MNHRERHLENAILVGITLELWTMLERRTEADDNLSDKLVFAIEDAARCISRTRDLFDREILYGGGDTDNELDEAPA